MKRARSRWKKSGGSTKKRSSGRTGKKLNRFWIFCISLVSILVMSVAVLGISSLFDQPEDPEESYTQPVEKATGKVNVLVLGVDKRGMLTDTMIVASYNTDENAIRLLSIPRDTRMYVGTHYQKINAAYATAERKKENTGAQGSIEAVSRLTGIPINYYVKFSTTAFQDLIDALGGVEFDVPQRMKYSDPTQDLYIDLKPGLQMLDGDKAEQLVRFRSYTNGDIDRVNMQQQFIQAVIDQKLNVGIITKIGDLFEAIEKNIETNADLGDVMQYVPNLMELAAENITMFQVPGGFSEKGQYDASYWIPDLTALGQLVEEEFGYDASKITTGKPGTLEKGSPAQATVKPATRTERPDDDDDDVQTASPKKTKKPTKSQEPTERPAATKKPTQKPTVKPTAAPTEKPEVTEKPTKTQAPTIAPETTDKTPQRPTANPKQDVAE